MYQITPDTAISNNILKNAEPETTQIPVKKRAAIAKNAFFVTVAEVNDNLTAIMNRTVRIII